MHEEHADYRTPTPSSRPRVGASAGTSTSPSSRIQRRGGAAVLPPNEWINTTFALPVLIIGSVIGAVSMLFYLTQAASVYHLDVGVFQDAGRAFLHGDDLYSEAFPTRSGFRFIYPPFAALLFAPLAWMGEHPMQIMWTLATVLAIFLTVGMAAHRLSLRPWWMWAVGLSGLALALDPIREHMGFGQINIFLIALVTADVLGYTPRWARGMGIGIAAGIKITPAAYAVIFLVRKDWWSVARSAGYFFLTAAIGAAVRFQESIYFWTTEFFITDRGGAPAYPKNQALTGVIARLGVSDDLARTIMQPGFLLLALIAVWAAWRLERAGRSVAALTVVVLAISLASPLAVTHHWAGIVLALPLVFRCPTRAVGIALALHLAAQAGGMAHLYPDQPFYGFTLGIYFLANAQGITGLILFATLVHAAWSLPMAGRQALDGAPTAEEITTAATPSEASVSASSRTPSAER